MRTCSVCWGVMVAWGCGGSKANVKPERPEGDAVAQLDPPPAEPPAGCLPSELQEAGLLSAALRGDTLGYCLEDGDAARCWTIDLTTGARGPALEPEARLARVGAPEVRVDGAGKEVDVCEAGVKPRCVTLTPKVPKGITLTADEVWLSSDARWAAIALVPEDGMHGSLELWKVDDKKRTASFKFGDGGDQACLSAVHFLGEAAVAVETSVCAGPGGAVTLYDHRGKRLGLVGEEGFNAYGAQPIAVGERWAFVDANVGRMLVVDASSARTVTDVDLDAAMKTDPKLGPDAWTGTNPGEYVATRRDDGRIVIVVGAPLAGRALVVDPAAGRVERVFGVDYCPAAP